jgi:hypothetical protein
VLDVPFVCRSRLVFVDLVFRHTPTLYRSRTRTRMGNVESR